MWQKEGSKVKFFYESWIQGSGGSRIWQVGAVGMATFKHGGQPFVDSYVVSGKYRVPAGDQWGAGIQWGMPLRALHVKPPLIQDRTKSQNETPTSKSGDFEIADFLVPSIKVLMLIAYSAVV